MAKASARPLRTIKLSAGTPSVSRTKLAQAARSVATGNVTTKSSARTIEGSALSQRSVIKPARGATARTGRGAVRAKNR